MSVILQLTPHDPLVARDGRPFGTGQGNRMRGMPWLLPSVVAGSFRTALVKAGSGLDFSEGMPQRLMKIGVAGVFPVHADELYLPAPNDAVAEPTQEGKGIKTLHRTTPQKMTGGCDFPDDLSLKPVMLGDGVEDFKPAEIPVWWPVSKYIEWLTFSDNQRRCDWFDCRFLKAAQQETRDHVQIDAHRGAAADGLLFATSGLNVTYLPRFSAEGSKSFLERFAQVSLSTRVTFLDSETKLTIGPQFDIWHPLGGERRLVHWKTEQADINGWTCPPEIRSALANTTKVRMVLATPAVFETGWKPGWLKNGLEGKFNGVKLKLVGVSNGRWKAVSGWSLAPPRGPKAIRRMVPAGSVYFFEVEQGDAGTLADLWLQSVSDNEQERHDGFSLAIWGTW